MDTAALKTLLRASGYRATPGRIALLALLSKEGRPLTVAQIGQKLRPALDPVTLYRALEALAQKGIIRRIDLGHSHAHYELEERHHHHVVCTNCGVVEDIESPLLERAVEKAATLTRRFKSIYSHNLEFFGRCKSCAA